LGYNQQDDTLCVLERYLYVLVITLGRIILEKLIVVFQLLLIECLQLLHFYRVPKLGLSKIEMKF